MNIDQNDIRLRGLSESVESGLEAQGASGGSKAGFKDMLSGMISEVDSLQKSADKSIQGLVEGKETSVHDIMIRLEEAGVAFELMMEIRNKLVDAYQQIIRMQP